MTDPVKPVEPAPVRRIRVAQDMDPMDPRDDENLGTLLTWHRRYQLGDKHSWGSPDAWETAMAYELAPGLEERQAREQSDCDTGPESLKALTALDARHAAERQAVLDAQIVMLPVYMYDHSGISLATSPFACRWDSGRLGVIYTARAHALSTYGETEWTPEFEARVQQGLRGEVDIYGKYVAGEVYEYTIQRQEVYARVRDGMVRTAWEDEDDGRCGGLYTEADLLCNVPQDMRAAASAAWHDMDKWH